MFSFPYALCALCHVSCIPSMLTFALCQVPAAGLILSSFRSRPRLLSSTSISSWKHGGHTPTCSTSRCLPSPSSPGSLPPRSLRPTTRDSGRSLSSRSTAPENSHCLPVLSPSQGMWKANSMRRLTRLPRPPGENGGKIADKLYCLDPLLRI